MRLTNNKGLLIAVLGFGSAFAARSAFPGIGENGFQYTAGAVIFLIDLIYRTAKLKPEERLTAHAQEPVGAAPLGLQTDLGKHWLTGSGGGLIAWIPAWIFGVLWPLLVVVIPDLITI